MRRKIAFMVLIGAHFGYIGTAPAEPQAIGTEFNLGWERRGERHLRQSVLCRWGKHAPFPPEHSVGVVSVSVLPATAADRYGEWVLEQPRSAVFTLSFKQSVPRNSKIATSELGFICDQKDQSALVGAILIPADGTFENRQRIIPVLILKKRGPI